MDHGDSDHDTGGDAKEIIFFLYGISLIVFYSQYPIVLALGVCIAVSHLYTLTNKGRALPRDLVIAGSALGMCLGLIRRDLYLILPFGYSFISKFV